jgi:hypothetical protein
MESVMCRPELHNATNGDQYRVFHAGMEQLGLGRTITSGDGIFRLPTGEYLGVGLPTSAVMGFSAYRLASTLA